MKVTEIFLSLQGETRSVGWPTVFVRLTGCPLRCHYCDTAYAFSGGEWFSREQVVERVRSFGVRHVTVTGGEPLAQRNCGDLLTALADADYQVSLETSGAFDVASVDPRVVKVVDLKTPASGEVHRNLWANIDVLSPRDQVKFVICDRDDYQWACAQISIHRLVDRCEVLFSPAYNELPARELAEWMLADRMPVRMQIQLHKYLWGDVPGR
ncbi:MAG: 7-carboxy-7-deazaguanine synthase QueE [Thiotrichales bacterium]